MNEPVLAVSPFCMTLLSGKIIVYHFTIHIVEVHLYIACWVYFKVYSIIRSVLLFQGAAANVDYKTRTALSRTLASQAARRSESTFNHHFFLYDPFQVHMRDFDEKKGQEHSLSSLSPSLDQYRSLLKLVLQSCWLLAVCIREMCSHLKQKKLPF